LRTNFSYFINLLSDVYAGGYNDVAFEKVKVLVGLELLQPTDVGVFHYEQTDSQGQALHQSKCALLSNHGTRVLYTHAFIVLTFDLRCYFIG